jgi:hypothetical protein
MQNKVPIAIGIRIQNEELSSMIEKIQVEREKVLCVNFLIHLLQDTINYLSEKTALIRKVLDES